MRDDRQRLEDILEAANFVLDFTRNRNKEALAKDQLLQSAVLQPTPCDRRSRKPVNGCDQAEVPGASLGCNLRIPQPDRP